MVNRSNLYARKLRERLIIQGGGECSFCGEKSILEFAHIKPTKLSGKSRGMKKRILDVKNNWSCYLLTCDRCNYLAEGTTKELVVYKKVE